MRRRGIAALAAILLLTGCDQSIVPYDYALSEYIQLGTYSGISYVSCGAMVRDIIEPEDLVTVELKTTVVGVDQPFYGTYKFEVGYSNFLDGFDDALVGAQVGQLYTVELTFPDPYEACLEFSGRQAEVQFRVIELDLSRYALADREALWEIAVDTSTVLQYPEAELETYQRDFRACYEAFAQEYGMTLNDYLQKFFGVDETGLEELCLENAKDSVKRDLVLYGILRTENLEVTEKDLKDCRPAWLTAYGYQREEDFPGDWQDPEIQESLRAMAELEKAKDFVYEHAVIQIS